MQNKADKKVIFVTGSSYSGSTILNLILANDSKGMSVGEIRSLMLPYRKHHYKKRQELSDDEKWKQVLNDGSSKLYKNLFELFPEYDFWVDSSKDPLWIYNQSKILQRQGFKVAIVLIYKSPLEFAQSALKRKQYKWQRKWISFHESFFYLLKEYHQISYYDFVAKPKDSLKVLCENLEIDFKDSKLDFWKKHNFNFFGNTHTNYQAVKDKSEMESRIIDKEYKSNFRKIKHSITLDESLQKKMETEITRNSRIQNILNKLNKRNQKFQTSLVSRIKIYVKKKQAKKSF